VQKDSLIIFKIKITILFSDYWYPMTIANDESLHWKYSFYCYVHQVNELSSSNSNINEASTAQPYFENKWKKTWPAHVCAKRKTFSFN
jgi:hypothetical protein